jgi:hypothetical protein
LVRNAIEAAIVPSIIGYQNVKLAPRSELLEINTKFCPLAPVRVGVRKRQSLSVLESHFVVANRLKMDGFDMRILPDLRDEVPNERGVLCHKRRSFRSRNRQQNDHSRAQELPHVTYSFALPHTTPITAASVMKPKDNTRIRRHHCGRAGAPTRRIAH